MALPGGYRICREPFRRRVVWPGAGRGSSIQGRTISAICIGERTVAANVRDLYIDPSGAVWGSTWQSGFFRLDDPDSDRPRVTRIGQEDGLASMRGGCITGDELGRIYFGTSNGVDRLDPATGSLLHLGTTDGL